MIPGKEIYLENLDGDLRRILCMLNRAPYSNEKGGFHRNYWHHRQSGFPSAIYQLGIHSLSLAYKFNFPQNKLYQKAWLLEQIESSLEYCNKIQKADGSYDEWYLNERGWAGPTGYITNAQVQTILLLKEDLNTDVVEETLKSIDKSASFLGSFWEEQILSNHIAMGLLPIIGAFKLTDESKHLENYEKLFDKFMDYHNKFEGWGLEYDGPDVGYQTATISFLGKISKIHQDERLFPIVEKSLDFIQYFFYPDFSFSNNIGSRSTSNLFVHGLEYWGSHFHLAAQLAGQVRIGLEKEKILRPNHCEDHYFIYRLPEFLEAYTDAQTQLPNQECEPIWSHVFVKTFEKAKMYINSNPQSYFVINLAKGGMVQNYNKNKEGKRLSCLNHGWYLRSKKGKIYSNINASKVEYRINDENLIIKGIAGTIKEDFFTPFTHITFNIIMFFFGRNKSISYFIKSIIRKRMMFSRGGNEVSFTREISLIDQKVIDQIQIENIEIESAGYSNNIQDRYVPQSKYFINIDETTRKLTHTEIQKLNSERRISLQMDL